MANGETSTGTSGRSVVATILAICGAIFAAAAALMDPSSTRVLMTVAAVVFVALAGLLLGLTMAKRRS